jgi:hypothetical protein
VVAVSEEPQPGASPSTPASPDVGQEATPASPYVGQEVTPASAARLSDIVTSHLADQARLTAQGARARRVRPADGQPGVADLTPLRELLAELAEEMQKVRPRERIARALRQAADALDPPAP